MSEKEIEELSKDIYSLFRSKTMSQAIASLLHKKGWRKLKEESDGANADNSTEE